MEKTIKLYFERPVNKKVPITERGGHFGDSRGHRSHNGLDFAAYLKPVHASEKGVVVYSGERAGPVTRTNYGKTIVIDHTPEMGPEERHIYTLYAHLENRSVHKGQKVIKGEAIGTSGNSGTKASYKKIKRGYHLHFEIIDAPRGFEWNGGWPIGLRPEHRKNPMGYFNVPTTIDLGLTDEDRSKIQDKLSYKHIVDLSRGTYRIDVSMDGKLIGHFDKDNLSFKAKVRI